MRKTLVTMALAFSVILGLGMTGCGGGSHHHEEGDHSGEKVGGAYTCPRHGGSYGSPKDHCKVCKNHVERK